MKTRISMSSSGFGTKLDIHELTQEQFDILQPKCVYKTIRDDKSEYLTGSICIGDIDVTLYTEGKINE